MEKKKHFNGEKVRMDITESLRLNPEKRLCPMYDSETIAKYSVAALDAEKSETHVILIMPVFVIVIMVLLLSSIIIWAIILLRKRKERSSRLVV